MVFAFGGWNGVDRIVLTGHVFFLAGDSGLPTHEIRKLGSILTIARVPKLVVTTTSVHLKQPCAHFKVTRFHNQGLASDIEVWTKHDEIISRSFDWNWMVKTQWLCAFPSWNDNTIPIDLIPIDQYLENSQWFAPPHAQAPLTGGHQMIGPRATKP